MPRNLHTLLRDLQRRKGRERRGLMIVEGRRQVREALESAFEVVGVLAADDVAGSSAEATLAACQARGIAAEVAPRRDFEALADTATPSGLLAVVRWSPLALDELRLEDRAIVLVLDAVQDPGNVGGMIRSAHTLGAAATIALDGTADLRGPKVVRGSMGVILHHRVAWAPAAELLRWRREGGVALWAAAPLCTPIRRDPAVPRLALVVGNEGAGVRREILEAAERRVSVPMRPGAESLNAGVAAAILLYELLHAD